ncbi:lipopolysaccharide export LptBFGC system permease protein LptF [Luteibacter sp. W1I16]|uniref:YtcA family lipoprotein n=1 Tax=Luteibacter sp. W1I16 TaxID=3373922 RepID=UPI003D1C3EF1
MTARIAVSAAMAVALASCSASPSRSILGSYFPSWMICALGGIVLTVLLRLALVKSGVDAELPAPFLVYVAFVIAFTLGIWLAWLA